MQWQTKVEASGSNRPWARAIKGESSVEIIGAIIKLTRDWLAFPYHRLLAILSNVNIPLHSTPVHSAVPMLLALKYIPLCGNSNL